MGKGGTRHDGGNVTLQGGTAEGVGMGIDFTNVNVVPAWGVRELL